MYSSILCFILKMLLFLVAVWCFIFGFVDSYTSITKYLIGNKTYFERFDQPWFRHMHYDHERVKDSEKDSSAFGKHYVPDDDVFIAPDWSKKEQKYLGCLNRTCVCGFYDGEVSNGECILAGGKKLKPAKRVELRMLSDKNRKLIEKTWNSMKKSGLYNRIGRVHKYSGVHSGPAFTIWHREFLKRLEIILRTHSPIPEFGIPFFDSTLDSPLPDPKESIIFSELFLGEVNEDGFVKNGPYHNWETMEGRSQILRKFDYDKGGELLNNARVDWLINNPDINMILGPTMPLTSCPMNHTLDARMLEYSHDYVHFFINGDMSKSYSSSNDIAFVYHHCMIDWIFEHWRQNQQTRQQREIDYPLSDERCFPFWHFAENPMPLLQPLKNQDALSNGYTDHFYEFDKRPSCTREKPDCGSKYLFCYLPENPHELPYCVSKLRRNGNCEGFEKYPICYWGKCIKGRCKESQNEHQKIEKPSNFLELIMK
ncbi:unnamed protein product [Caenorhabditis angaria]|uniref:Tyrosinase copper-binding domain-containing protein n=1 Tax=Caenorhabditis angaria TaxID=860376 RepID=A0A9P1I5Z9_9PELO|nr:unnamed protein product [Caenorhabditis angaria]